MKIVPVTPEIRCSAAFSEIRRAWPEIVFHDEISNAYWGRLYEERREFQFALVDDDGELLAEGNSTPVSGMPASWREAIRNGFEDGAADRLCAIAILIDPDHQRCGLSRLMLEHIAQLEQWSGLAFPESGSYVVEGALVPIEIDRERDHGSYREPNVRMRHPRA